MGRAFATVYRIVLVGVSLAALILSIMSATSCAFIKYDHQYKDDNENDGGRFLFSLSSSSSLSSSFGVTHQRQLPQSTAMPENDDAPTDDAPTEDAPTDDAPLTTTTTTTATDDATTDDDGATKDVIAHSNGTKTTTTKYSNGTSTVANLHPNGTKVTTHSDGTTITSHPTPTTTSTGGGNNQITHASGGTTSVVRYPNGTTTAIMKHPNGTTVTNNPDGTSTTVHNNINVVADDDSIPVNDDATSPSTSTPALGSSSSSSSSSVVTGAAAATTGDAGLFCHGIQSFTITSLWNGSYQDLEDKIADDSDRNQSEELARNAAIVASLFGSVIIVILSIGGSIGWRCFCERWIVGLVALMACVSQGITFLYFNSERYCDGDIINEIINQKPCILGEGGKDSVAALALYAIVMVLGCRLPQDDPYGWCSRCKMGGGRNAGYSSNNDPIGDGGSPGGGGKSSSGLLFGSSKNGSSSSSINENNTARSGREHERPNWLSEEAAREKEEHEII